MGIRAVKFRGRHNSWRALLVLVTGSLAIVLFIAMSAISAMNNETSFGYGVAGVIAALVSLIGLIVSVRATKERDIFMSVPIAGMVVNGISFLLYVVIYVLGLV